MTTATTIRGTGRRLALAVRSGLLAVLLAAAAPAAAVEPATGEPVTVEGSLRDGIGRLTLTFQAPVRVDSKTENGRLVLRFDRPCAADLSRLESLAPIAGPPERSADGLSLSLPLHADVTAFSIAIDRSVHVQLLPRALLAKGWSRPAKRDDTAAGAADTGSRPSRRSGSTPAPAARPQRDPAAAETTPLPAPPPWGGAAAPRPTAPAPPPVPPAAPPPAAPAPALGPTSPAHAEPPPVPSPASAAAAAATPPPPPGDRAATPPTLRFAWRQPTAATIFKRGAALWVVFDRSVRLDLAALRAMAGPAVTSIEQPPHRSATLLRLGLARPLHPRVQRDGSAWLVQLVEAPVADAEPLIPRAEDSGTPRARLTLAVAEPASPVRFTDTDVGDELIAVPLIPLGRGIRVTHAYPHLALLPSAQGLVIQPLSDALQVRSTSDGIEITLPQGLALSPPSADAATRSLLRLVENPGRLLPAAGWGDATRPFSGAQAAAMETIAGAAGAARETAMNALAQLYVGHGMAAEALGMISAIERDTGAAALPPVMRLLRGIANVLMVRPDEARADLAIPELAATDEGTLWLALADAAAGRPVTTPDALDAWVTVADGYPRPLREAALLALLDVAVTAGRSGLAARLITALRGNATEDRLAGWLDLQEGRLKLLAGDLDAAAALWQRATDSTNEPARARALFERSVALLQAGRLSRDAAISDLDGLRMTWRGDDLEFRTLSTLGRLHAEQEDVAAALRTWRDALSRFPGHHGSAAIADAMSALFERAFRDGLVERLPPWQAVALFHEFNELSPTGPRGDALLLAYARRLAAADLPAKAAAIIETLLQGQRSNAQRAEFGLELAGYFLRDGQPEAALAALGRTQDPAAQADIAHARRLAEAEALRALGRLSEASARLDDDRTPAAHAARLRVARASADWPQVSRALEGLSEGGDDAIRQALLIDRAAALTLAGDGPALLRLRQQQAARPTAGADVQLFDLLTAAPPRLTADTAKVRSLVEDAKHLAAATGARPAATTGP